MALFFTKTVHAERNAEYVTFRPGDPVPDWWAEGRDINPEVVEDRDPNAVKPDDTPPASTGTTDDGDGLDAMTAAQLKEVAAGLGITARGNKATVKAAIRAARADNPDDEASQRAELEAAATAHGIEFDSETTDAELEALIEGA